MKARGFFKTSDLNKYLEDSVKEDRKNRMSVYFYVLSFITIVLLFFISGILMLSYHLISKNPDLLAWDFRVLVLIFITLIAHIISFGWLEERKVSFSKVKYIKTRSLIRYREHVTPFKERIFDTKIILSFAFILVNTLGIITIIPSADQTIVFIYFFIFFSSFVIGFYKSRRTLIVNKDEIIYYEGPDIFFRSGFSGKKITRDRILGVVPRTVPVGEYILPGLIMDNEGFRLVKTGIQVVYSMNRTDSFLTSKPLEIKSIFEGRKFNKRRDR
jgi:hypothetical protein